MENLQLKKERINERENVEEKAIEWKEEGKRDPKEDPEEDKMLTIKPKGLIETEKEKEL